MDNKPVKNIICTNCSKAFEESLHLRQCSNCFACTSCEIYTCPYCGATVEVVPMKPMKKKVIGKGLENNEL